MHQTDRWMLHTSSTVYCIWTYPALCTHTRAEIGTFDRCKCTSRVQTVWRAEQWPAAAGEWCNTETMRSRCVSDDGDERIQSHLSTRGPLWRHQHLIPSPPIDVTTSICSRFAPVISYPTFCYLSFTRQTVFQYCRMNIKWIFLVCVFVSYKEYSQSSTFQTERFQTVLINFSL